MVRRRYWILAAAIVLAVVAIGAHAASRSTLANYLEYDTSGPDYYRCSLAYFANDEAKVAACEARARKDYDSEISTYHWQVGIRDTSAGLAIAGGLAFIALSAAATVTRRRRVCTSCRKQMHREATICPWCRTPTETVALTDPTR
jgi:hypothetical protein